MSKDLPSDQYADSKNLSTRISLHDRFSTNPQGWPNWLFEQFDLRKVSRILELGSGPAGMWLDRLQDLPAKCRVVLSDISPGMVSEARQALIDERFAFAVIDAQAIPYPDETFDCVIANHMLYHVPDTNRALSEVARVLEPGGKFYAATNGTAHMRELFDLILRAVPDFQISVDVFSLESGEAKLRRHFSRVTAIRYEDGLVVPDASALSAYALSLPGLSHATQGQVREIERIIAEEIDRQGRIIISKDGGLFISVR